MRGEGLRLGLDVPQGDGEAGPPAPDIANLTKDTLGLSLEETQEVIILDPDTSLNLAKDILDLDLDSTLFPGNSTLLDLAISAVGLPWPTPRRMYCLSWP